jgi:S-DNA-T family DNA segregation ATPase FtsK/SpoIIIE
VLGVTGAYADPVDAALAPGEHLIVLGNAGSGRSGLLRSIAAAAARRRQPWQIDPRRSLRACDGDRHAVTPAQITALLTDLIDALTAGSRHEPQEHLLIIDDLDLASARGCAGAFAGLAEWLPFAADAGLSIVAARRMSGSSRASFEPFYGRLVESCTTALLLSGDPGEGPVLGGVRPVPRPPGRGQLVRYGEPAELIQAAWLDQLASTVTAA